jgi:hypothetical protein
MVKLLRRSRSLAILYSLRYVTQLLNCPNNLYPICRTPCAKKRQQNVAHVVTMMMEAPSLRTEQADSRWRRFVITSVRNREQLN